ncbi:MAG: 5'/3'-nucleotidase SurE [Planctomycetes bacterium]|nr:5'/3'-nucleotidase SurE [Planctomycetota bacterium]
MILLVNDDGIAAPGLRALYRALRRVTGIPVLAVAPLAERSGQGHAITLDRGLAVAHRLEEGFFGFSVDGTPVDCAKLALVALCPEPPDLVVSGINDGPNVGRSLFYSGTVGAAMEAAVLGLPALAVSRAKGGESFDDAAEFAAQWAKRLLGKADLRGQVVNLNVPAGPLGTWKEARVTHHGQAGFTETYQPQRDAKDRVVWRLHGEWTATDGGACDAHTLHAGHPVVTVLSPDLNGTHQGLERLVRKLARPSGPPGPEVRKSGSPEVGRSRDHSG